MISLVTGASGFIGQHLVRALMARGGRVRCLVRQSSASAPLQALGAELCLGDIRRPDTLPAAVSGVDVVWHLAGLIKALRYRDLLTVNADGVANVAAACAAQASAPVLVVVSSIAAAGPSSPDRPRVESDPAAPVSHYGHSKRAGELAAEAMADRVPISIVRPPIVFGEGDHGMLPMFSAIARTGIHLTPGFGTSYFSLIHADDLVDCLIRAAERGQRLPAANNSDQTNIGQGYYFVASNETVSYDELGRRIGQALGRANTRVVHMPMSVAWGVGAAGSAWAQLTRSAGMVSLDKIREAAAGSWTCSDARARQELGFQPAACLTDRLKQTADGYRQLGWL